MGKNSGKNSGIGKRPSFVIHAFLQETTFVGRAITEMQRGCYFLVHSMPDDFAKFFC